MTPTHSISFASLLLASACVVGSDAIPDDDDPTGVLPQPTTPLVESVLGGTFGPLGAFTGVQGRALLVRQLDGKSDLSISLSGGTPNGMYVAHVHIASCQFQASAVGTGHYKIDPAVLETIETNELWVHAQASATGVMTGSTQFNHLARGDALSVVVHDPVLGKMACADLVADEVAPTVEMSGTIKPFAAALPIDQTIAGTITATRTDRSTSFTLNLTGLDPAALGYGTHIHAQPCEVATAGGHYLIDPTVPPPAIELNEIWLPVPTGQSAATSTKVVTFAARSDAQSIVLHRTTDVALGTKPKVACANLVRQTTRAPLETTASALALPAASGMSLTGTALMTRKLTGVTEVAVVLTGLAPDSTYSAHVHNQPCSVDAGGAHYMFDRARSDDPDNEMTFALVANAEGTASDSTWAPKIAHADAASVVVHTTDGARLACFDLK